MNKRKNETKHVEGEKEMISKWVYSLLKCQNPEAGVNESDREANFPGKRRPALTHLELLLLQM